MLSFNRWAEFHPLETFGVLPGRTIYVVQDYVAANISCRWLPVMRFVVPPAIASIMVISMLG